MKVCKFGGSSVADDVQVAKICDIIAADPARRIVVVSAPGKRNKQDTKVTDLLIACAAQCLEQKDAQELLDAIIERYAVIYRGLGLDKNPETQGVLDEIRADLTGRAVYGCHEGRGRGQLRAYRGGSPSCTRHACSL